jgi:hypothetical protein
VDVELREITSETVRAICELEAAANQHSFVAPNALSIAEAHFTPGHRMRGIYADGQPVGFVLTFDEPSEGYFLWRFKLACSTSSGLIRALGGRKPCTPHVASARLRASP